MPVTIIIPVYNRKELVLRTLQTIPSSYPLIIVDNGSTDGSYELCRQWMLNSHRQNVRVEREFKRGAASARNKGLSLCKTKWVYFFDSDDEFTSIPESWNEDAEMICFPTVQVVNGKVQVRAYKTVDTPHTQILSSMLNTISTVYRTEWLRGIGGWNEDCLIWDDWELGIRALMHRPKLQWKSEHAYHRVLIHGDSITGNSFSEQFEREMNTIAIVFDTLHDFKDDDIRHKALFALFLRCYIFCGQLLNEGNKKASDDVETFIYDKFRVNKDSHKLGRLFRWYVSKGGRRAWRVALALVNKV